MKKLTGRHRTLEKSLRPTFQWLDGLDSVYKIILGNTENAKHKYAPGTLRVREERDHGVLINCYHGRGITEAFISTKTPEILSEQIKKKFT